MWLEDGCKQEKHGFEKQVSSISVPSVKYKSLDVFGSQQLLKIQCQPLVRFGAVWLSCELWYISTLATVRISDPTVLLAYCS